MKVSREWYKTFFVNSFYNPASAAAVARAPEEAAFALRQFRLKKGAALLDLCCGPGRHAVEFAKKGLTVTGLDLSEEYLGEAADRAKKKQVRLRLLKGDMRELAFRAEFDAVVSMFTSFGYFLDLSDDLKTLKGAARALKPGGLFLVDVIHGDFVRANFRPRNWEELPDHYLLEEAEAFADGMINTWIKLPKRTGRSLKRSFFTRLYDRRTLSAAFKKAGLKPLKFWGGFDGRPLSPKSVRLIALAGKPG